MWPSQLLHALRLNLEAGEIFLGTSDLRLNPGLLQSDVEEFDAVLDGFFLSGAPEFERWVEAERGTLARACAEALESLAADAVPKATIGRRPVGGAAWRTTIRSAPE